MKTNKTKEIITLFLIAAAVLCAFMLWAPAGATGFVGVLFKKTIFGTVGSVGLALPVLLVLFALDRIFAKRMQLSKGRRTTLLLIFFLIAILIGIFALDRPMLEQMATVPGTENPSVFKSISLMWRGGVTEHLIHGNSAAAGGLIGDMVAYSLIALAGKVGAIIITIVMMLALLVLLFNLSFSQYISRGADKVMQARDHFEERRRMRELERDYDDYYEEVEPLPLPDKSTYNIDLTGRVPESRPYEVSGNWLREQLEQERAEKGEPEDTNPAEDDTREADIPAYEYSLPSGDWTVNNDHLTDGRPSTAPVYEPINRPEPEPPVRREPAHEPIAGQEPVPREATSPVKSDVDSAPIPEADLEDATDGREKWEDRGEDKAEVKVRPTKQVSMLQKYQPPPIKLLNEERGVHTGRDQQEIQALGVKLEETLKSFGVDAEVVNYTTGPTITRFEVAPGPGVKVSRILGLSDDIALSLAAIGVRIEAPIPGKSAVGIEIPNKEVQPVLLRGLIESQAFKQQKSALCSAIGRDIQGTEILCDIAKMPHLLIAGATGSGKSVCINSILISLLYRSSPEDLRLLMIDPKVVELSVYNGIPHLLQPVVTDPKKANGVLQWAVDEMTDRYAKFADNSVRDFRGFNQLVEDGHLDAEDKMPLILIVIDELSDLMATAANEVETAIARLTAMARAAGIHLIIATQRPSVDVITGVIKANIPSRIAFSVASSVDSRTIIDMNGAEKLLGKGDMLYCPQSSSKATRGQGAFVTDAEVERVVDYLKNLYPDNYDESVGEAIEKAGAPGGVNGGTDGEERDELFEDALKLVIETGYASISMVQRRLSVGYPRAARIIDQLSDAGYVSQPENNKPRKVLVTWDEYLEDENQE